MKSFAKTCPCGVRLPLCVVFFCPDISVCHAYLVPFLRISPLVARTATFQSRADVFPEFLTAVFRLPRASLRASERVAYVTFLIHLYQSLEDPTVRRTALKCVVLHVTLFVHFSLRTHPAVLC